ncbi:MAG: 5-(carboxyamino)imidazole ribonucleotide synthase [Bacteroidota bacterium]
MKKHWYGNQFRLGMLGGGQLGRMFIQEALNYDVHVHCIDPDQNAPCKNIAASFQVGSLMDYETILAFGADKDVITVEIEHVNVEALSDLEKAGVRVFPQPKVLSIVQDKGLQKQFYKTNQIPTSDFIITNNLAELNEQESFLPAVHKVGEGGYDGKGVQLLKTKHDTAKGFDAPAVLEKMVTIEKEIAMIVAVDNAGDMVFYPAVDMVFDHDLNLLSHQISPAHIPDKIFWRVEAISIAVVKALQSPGIFAVELFIDKQGEVYVNETAPRVHNSGHHTIEANYSSQFDMLWRIMLDYPLGSTEAILPAAIVNLLGADGYSGTAYYEGLEEVLKIPNSFVHIYGKKETKPGRKMGHVTVLSKEKQELIHQVNRIKSTLKVIAK